jgi:hypothetical protein
MDHTLPPIVETSQQKNAIDWTERILTPRKDVAHNPKIAHSVKYWREQGIDTRPNTLYLVPWKMSGANLCPDASPGCIAACVTSPRKGFGRFFGAIEESRQRRAQRFIEDRERFLRQLAEELETEQLSAMKAGKIVTCRLNMASDIDWTTFSIAYGANLFGELGGSRNCSIRFYDYTKRLSVLLRNRPLNYHLTFSRSENNHAKCLEAIDAGHNVAVVFSQGPEFSGSKKAYQQKLPETWTPPGYGKEIRVIDGDTHDFRCWDEPGVIVGLRMKGTESEVRHALRTGFAVYCGENR